MRTRTRHRLAALVAVLTIATTAPLAAPAAPAGAAPRPTRVEAERLPGVLVPRGIAEDGRVLAVDVSDPAPDTVVVVDDDGDGGFDVTTVGPWEQYRHPLCPDEQCFYPLPTVPFVNRRGLVGTAIGGHATLWDEGRTTDLNGDALGSWLVHLNDRGEALVVRFFADHQEVGVWHQGAFTEVEALPLDVVVTGRLSDRGHVIARTLVVRPPWPTYRYFTWHRGVLTDLGNFEPSDVDRRGRIVGTTTTPGVPFSQRAAVWDGGVVTELPTLGGWSTARLVNERGRIAGSSARPGGSGTAVVWDDGVLVEVGTAAGMPASGPVDLNERGQVLLSGPTPEGGRAQAALWDERGSVLLPPSGEPDRYVYGHHLNDRGQVSGNVATSSELYIPMRWTTWR
jgi:uncharacterized membrane protein